MWVCNPPYTGMGGSLTHPSMVGRGTSHNDALLSLCYMAISRMNNVKSCYWHQGRAYIVADDELYYCRFQLKTDAVTGKQICYECDACKCEYLEKEHKTWTSKYTFDGLLSEREWQTKDYAQ